MGEVKKRESKRTKRRKNSGMPTIPFGLSDDLKIYLRRCGVTRTATSLMTLGVGKSLESTVTLGLWKNRGMKDLRENWDLEKLYRGFASVCLLLPSPRTWISRYKCRMQLRDCHALDFENFVFQAAWRVEERVEQRDRKDRERRGERENNKLTTQRLIIKEFQNYWHPHNLNFKIRLWQTSWFFTMPAETDSRKIY